MPDTPAGEAVQYVLDGQQRLASLFVSIDGRKVPDPDDPTKYTNYKEFYINLEKDPDSNFDENLSLFIASLAAAQSVETIGNSKPVSKVALLKTISHSLK